MMTKKVHYIFIIYIYLYTAKVYNLHVSGQLEHQA